MSYGIFQVRANGQPFARASEYRVLGRYDNLAEAVGILTRTGLSGVRVGRLIADAYAPLTPDEQAEANRLSLDLHHERTEAKR